VVLLGLAGILAVVGRVDYKIKIIRSTR
jgi:hypothetical protein